MKTHSGLLVYYTVCILLGIGLAKVIEEPALRLRDYLSNRGAGVAADVIVVKANGASPQAAFSRAT